MKKANILIIDDNAMNLDITKDLLEHAGFQTLEAEDAITGIQLMKSKKPDFVLLDLLMPHIDGFEALQMIQADSDIKKIPVVAFTALASSEDREKALQLGCKGIIVKPIDTRTFIPTIELYLYGKSTMPPEPIIRNTTTFHLVENSLPLIHKPHTILIVDDNPMNVDVLKEAVGAMGQVAITATSGKETLQVVELNKPDLILLDIMMPEMDGYAVLEALKGQDETLDIPVIIISAMERTEDRVKGLLQGGCDFISKPFELVEVQARIAAALRVKDLQDQLKKERDELWAVNQELEHFTTVASHDLQAPLRKIQIFSEQIQRSAQSHLANDDQDALQRINNSANRMQNLLWDLLALSRARYKRKEPKHINLENLVQDVLLDLKEITRESKAHIEVSNLPTIEADEMQIRQLVYNLISNALKFQQEGKAPVIRIYAKPVEEDKIQLIIEDNGIGFNEEQAETIFKPFERLSGMSKKYPGSGIGLAICKKVAERHGGQITAKSTPNSGSTFIVQLPIKQQVEAIA